MQHKLQVWWKGGIIETNPLTGTITIRQGAHNENVITIVQSDRGAFLADLDSQPWVSDIPTGQGFGGTIEKLPDKPKKPVTGSVLSMDDLIFNMKCIANGWKTLKK